VTGAQDTAFDDGLGELTAADGPWSLADAPTDRAFIDFGPLRLPAIAGIKVRAEVDRASQRIGAVTVLVADCEVQLQVIAAPRGQGGWTDVRRALAQTVRRKSGFLHTVEGRFGPELIATVTGRDSRDLLRDVTFRHVGIDGDRWLLRAVVMGPSVAEDATVARVDALLSQCAVDRGTEALPRGTVMALSKPPGAPAAGGGS